MNSGEGRLGQSCATTTHKNTNTNKNRNTNTNTTTEIEIRIVERGEAGPILRYKLPGVDMHNSDSWLRLRSHTIAYVRIHVHAYITMPIIFRNSKN